MRSSTMTRGFRTFTLHALAGAAVLVFHSAADAQQTKPDTKKADQVKAEAKASDEVKPDDTDVFEVKPEVKPEDTKADEAKPEPAAPAADKPGQPEDMPPEYAPPPGYRRSGPPPGYRRNAPPPRGYPQGYGPYYDYYYGAPPYPPHRYHRPRRYPVRYYPEPLTYRPFFFGIGLGIGGVAFFPEGDGENSSRAGMAYSLQFGLGVSPHWSIVFAGDGAYAYFSGYDVSQSVWTIGPQVFINRHLYVRGGFGFARKSVDNDSSWDYYSYNYYSDSGIGGTLAIGWEFMQSYHASLGLEAAAAFGRYKDPDPITGSRNQGTIGVNFLLKLF